MCWKRNKKTTENTSKVAESKKEVSEVLFDIGMVPVAPPKGSSVYRPEVKPEEFIVYPKKDTANN